MHIMKTHTRFRPYERDQLLLLPPDMKDWLPEKEMVWFILDVVDQLDLEPIYRRYDNIRGGQPPYDPRMMTALLLYAYCLGLPSSRKIEKATYERITFRVLTADQHPDHDTIANFRKTHLNELAGLFVQILQLCQKAGLVKLGHVSLDGTKVKANASKHKAMSYGRMEKKVPELRAEIDRLMAEAEQVDADEDDQLGKGQRGDDLPEELKRRESRLARIQAAMAELEAEAQQKAEQTRQQQAEKEAALAAEGRKRRGPAPKAPDEKPAPKAQRNFTDPESRIMKDGATKAFEQAYNCQAAVDETTQVIVATNVTQQTNDKQQVEPLIEDLKAKNAGKAPEIVSADSGYFSERNIEYLQSENIDEYIATGRMKHGEDHDNTTSDILSPHATIKEKMAHKLRTVKGRGTYKKRKHIVEPVFGQIKEVRGFRRFLLRGLDTVTAEWEFVCLTHNLLKLFRYGALQ